MEIKKPNRSAANITQTYNDGIVKIYAVTDEATPGRQPVTQLVKKIALRYEERTVGVRRYYEARQNQIRIEKVIRCQRFGEITNQDLAQIDGRVYAIEQVQTVRDVFPASVDLTLTAVRQGVQHALV